MEEKKSESHPKWEAKVSTTLTKATPDQIFTLFKDFFNLHKWFPALPTCYGIHGDNGEPGCIRYCAGFGIPSDDDQEVSWSKERLVAVDPIGRSLTYHIVDCNIGFKSYVSTVQISPGGGRGGGDGGCSIEWSISLDPVEGCRFEDLLIKYQVGLNAMAKKMEEDAL